MTILFYISLITIALGGSIYLLLRYDEYNYKFIEGSLKLFVILGLILSAWGAYFLYSGETLGMSFRGPVNGAQYIAVGLFISLFSGYQAFKVIKEKQE